MTSYVGRQQQKFKTYKVMLQNNNINFLSNNKRCDNQKLKYIYNAYSNKNFLCYESESMTKMTSKHDNKRHIDHFYLGKNSTQISFISNQKRINQYISSIRTKKCNDKYLKVATGPLPDKQ